jgi:hypothetical protein
MKDVITSKIAGWGSLVWLRFSPYGAGKEASREAEVSELYAKIGQLTV